MISSHSRGVGTSCSRHDVPMRSARCTVPTSPAPCSARPCSNPLISAGVISDYLRHAALRPHIAAIGLRFRGDVSTIPNGNTRDQSGARRVPLHPPPQDFASTRCCHLTFKSIGHNRGSHRIRGRQNDRFCTQFIDGRGSTDPAGVPAQPRQGFQSADDDPLLRHSRCRAVVSSPTASMPTSMRPAPRSRPTCLIFCCSSRC